MSTSISFHGDNIEITLEANPLVYRAIWDACSAMKNSSIRIDATPRIDAEDTLEWSMSIASPQGRRSVTVIQKSPGSAVRFSNY